LIGNGGKGFFPVKLLTVVCGLLKKISILIWKGYQLLSGDQKSKTNKFLYCRDDRKDKYEL